MFTLEELYFLKRTGDQFKENGMKYDLANDPNPFTYTEREPMTFEVPMEGETLKFQDGDATFLPPGSNLPKLFGERQAAEKESPTKNYTRYDPERHKLKLPEVREGIAQITANGLKEGLKQSDILRKIDLFTSAAGYTEAELNPRVVTDDVIRTESYNSERPNPYPWTKLLMSFAGSIGGTAGGARIGAMIGSSVAPGVGTIAGGILGGTVGYLSGLIGYEGLLNGLNSRGMLYTPTYNEVGEFMGYKQGIDRPDIDETIGYLKDEAKRDLLWGTAFGMFRPGVALLKGFGRNVLGGVGKNEIARAKEIEELTGITPGTTDISRYGFVRAMPVALTKVPFLGGGFRKGFEEKRGTFLKEVDKMFNFGPSINAAELGHDLSKVRQQVTSDIIQNVSKKYQNYFEAIGNAPVFDVSSVHALAQKTFNKYSKLLDPEQQAASPAFKKLAALAGRGNGKMNGEEWLYHRQTLNDILFSPRNKADYAPMMDEMYAISREMETAFGKMTKLQPGIYNQAFENLKEADRAFADMTVLFGSTAAKKLGMDEKYAYTALAKVPGSIEADQLFSRVFNDFQSPAAVEKLHQFIGPETFAKGMKAKLLDAFESSFTQSKQAPGFQKVDVDYFKSFDNLTFNAETFKRRLGVIGAGKKGTEGVNYAAFNKGMELVGDELPSAKKLIAFADAAELFFNSKNMNISQFLTRKTTLGGVRGFLTGVLPSLAVAGSTGSAIPGIGTLAGVILARKMGYVMSSPISLNLFADAMKASAGSAKQGRLFGEAIQALIEQYPDLPEELENEFNNIQNRASGNPTVQELYQADMKKTQDLSVDDFFENLKKNYQDTGVGDTFIEPGMRVNQTPQVKEKIINENDPSPNIVPKPKPDPDKDAPVIINPGGLNVQNKTLNPASRLALAGNDPLLSAIAAQNTRRV